MTTLTPAYGRDYKSKAALLADWNDNKDFILNDITSRWDGKYCNKSDLQKAGITNIQFRYGKLRKTFIERVD